MSLDLPDNVDDVHVENAPVRALKHGPWTIEGWSRAAVQTYWRIPELRMGFDFGLQPWSFMGTPNWAVSHTHMDHIAALPAYVSRRRMMKMEPPVVYVPESSIDDIEDMLSAFHRLDRGRMPCELVPVRPGDVFDLSRDVTLTPFETFHTIPSVGYAIHERRRKLLPEYQGLPGDRIRDLRLAGVEITREERVPLVAYLGDSNPRGLDGYPDLYRARVLILEISFFGAAHRRDRIHKYGHIHLDDIVERADLFENELVIASHFSTRYRDDQIRRMVERQLPRDLAERLKLWL